MHFSMQLCSSTLTHGYPTTHSSEKSPRPITLSQSQRNIDLQTHTHTDTYTRHTHTVGARSSSSSRLCWSPTSFHVIINDSEPSAHFDPHTHAHLQLALIMDFLMELRQKNERTPPFFFAGLVVVHTSLSFSFQRSRRECVWYFVLFFTFDSLVQTYTHAHTHEPYAICWFEISVRPLITTNISFREHW